MNDSWSQIDHELLECLTARGPMALHELAHELNVPEGEAIAFVAMLAREGRVRIRLVEAVQPVERPSRSRPSTATTT